MQEIWKDIPGYEGLYKISNFGEILSLNFRGNGRGNKLKKNIDKSGYLRVCLYKSKIRKIHWIHKLVSMVFLGHKPDGHKLVVDHIDNNQSNNRLDNLQIITNRENCTKDVKNKTSKYTGVYWNSNRNKWQAQIKHRGKTYYLGQYVCEKQSNFAYKIAKSNVEGGLYD